jgi:hypothetical protein
MTDTVHLSFGKDNKKYKELHDKAVAEGRRTGNLGLTSQIYCKALMDHFGISTMSYNEAKKELERIEEERALTSTREEHLKRVIAEFEEKENKIKLEHENLKIKHEEEENKRIEKEYLDKIQLYKRIFIERFFIDNEDAEVEAESLLLYKQTPSYKENPISDNQYLLDKGYELKPKPKPAIKELSI